MFSFFFFSPAQTTGVNSNVWKIPPSPFIFPSSWSYLNFWRASMGGYTSILKLNLLQQMTDGTNLCSFNKGHKTLLIGNWSMLSFFFSLLSSLSQISLLRIKNSPLFPAQMLVFTLGQDFSNQFKKIKHPMAITLPKEQIPYSLSNLNNPTCSQILLSVTLVKKQNYPERFCRCVTEAMSSDLTSGEPHVQYIFPDLQHLRKYWSD